MELVAKKRGTRELLKAKGTPTNGHGTCAGRTRWRYSSNVIVIYSLTSMENLASVVLVQGLTCLGTCASRLRKIQYTHAGGLFGHGCMKYTRREKPETCTLRYRYHPAVAGCRILIRRSSRDERKGPSPGYGLINTITKSLFFFFFFLCI